MKPVIFKSGLSYTSCRYLSRLFEQAQRSAMQTEKTLQTEKAMRWQSFSGPNRDDLYPRIAEAGLSIWDSIEAWLAHNGGVTILPDKNAEGLVAMDPLILHDRLVDVWQQNINYAWSMLRSHTDFLFDFFCRTASTLEELKTHYPEEYLSGSSYWFRRDPKTHMATGFHTAISCLFKLHAASYNLWVGAASTESDLALKREALKVLHSPELFLQHSRPLLSLARVLATCHLCMLQATDGVLWDSAGSTSPHGFFLVYSENGSEYFLDNELLENSLSCFSRLMAGKGYIEPRSGCPALLTVREDVPSLFGRISDYVTGIFMEYCFPLYGRGGIPGVCSYKPVDNGILLTADSTHYQHGDLSTPLRRRQ